MNGTARSGGSGGGISPTRSPTSEGGHTGVGGASASSGRWGASTASLSSDAPDVKPVPVDSDRELDAEVSRIGAALSSTKTDWKKRMDALARLRGLLLGGAADFSHFPKLVRRLREPLITQACDLRSRIAKAACAAIGELAVTLGGLFEPHAHFFVAAVVKLTVVTIQVISTAGDRCIRLILKSTHRGFPLVVQA